MSKVVGRVGVYVVKIEIVCVINVKIGDI